MIHDDNDLRCKTTFKIDDIDECLSIEYGNFTMTFIINESSYHPLKTYNAFLLYILGGDQEKLNNFIDNINDDHNSYSNFDCKLIWGTARPP